MAGSAATRHMSDISPHLSHQDRVNLEIFKAVEMLGRRLEKSETNRNILVERLSDLESSATRDEKTGRFYLPMVIDPATLPQPVFSAPRWMVASSVTSTAVACLALAMVLLREPVMLPHQGAMMASGDGGYKASVMASIGPDSSGWKAVDLKSVSSSELARAEIEAAKIKSIARNTPEPDPVLEPLPELETASVAPLAELAPAAGIPEEALKAEIPAGLSPSEETAALPETSPVLEKPIPVVEAQKPVALVKAASPVKADVKEIAKKETPKPLPVKAEAPEEKTAALVAPDLSLPDEVKELEIRAFKGSPEAQHDLATLYASGKLATLDYGRSLYWFTKAAEGGIANAHYNLGVMYHQGLGVAPDMKQALKWYENAAELGHPEAMYNLGIAYVEGVGVASDIGRGVSFFKRAADAGVPQAAYNLGVLYESSFIGAADAGKAREWYKKAAELGHAEAAEALARLDDNSVPTGVGGTPAMLAAKEPDAVEPSAGDEDAGFGEGDMSMPDDDVVAVPAAPVARNGEVDTRLIAKIQNILIDRGLLPGKSNGVLDDKTGDAIRSWQKSAGLPVDGKPTQNLLDYMLYSNNPAVKKK